MIGSSLALFSLLWITHSQFNKSAIFWKVLAKKLSNLSTKHLLIVWKHHQKKAVTFYEYVSFAVMVENVKKQYSKNKEWPTFTYLRNSSW